MTKYIILVITILGILRINQAIAQGTSSPDKEAINLLIAMQSINAFADSLNLINNSNQLPKFLSDHLFDWKITKGLCDYVTPTHLSFRKVIMDHVVREDVLRWIIDSKNTTYDALYDPVKLKEQDQLKTRRIVYHSERQGYCELSFMNLSFRDLARLRLATLHDNRHRIDR